MGKEKEKIMVSGRIIFCVLSFFCLTIVTGCVTSSGTKATVTSGQGGPSIQEAQMVAYDGPKARVAVAKFTNKAASSGGGWFTPALGNGMADQMTTALFNTNRYIVLERESLGTVLSEQDLGASGRIKKGTEAQIGEIEGAELLIVGAITEFSGHSSGGSGALDALGLGILGNIAGGFKKAHMAIDIRVIDAKTSRILAATSVEGEATDVDLGGGLAGSALSAGLGGWKNTPMEKALRICINKAVDFIVTKTPEKYYRHGKTAPTETVVIPEKPKKKTTSLTRSMIRKKQAQLNALGFNVGTPDGIAGKKTRKALQDFQWEHDLEETGRFDPETIKKLQELSGE